MTFRTYIYNLRKTQTNDCVCYAPTTLPHNRAPWV